MNLASADISIYSDMLTIRWFYWAKLTSIIEFLKSGRISNNLISSSFDSYSIISYNWFRANFSSLSNFSNSSNPKRHNTKSTINLRKVDFSLSNLDYSSLSLFSRSSFYFRLELSVKFIYTLVVTN